MPTSVPGARGFLVVVRQTLAFLSDWQGTLQALREETGSTVFHLGIGMPVVAAIDHDSIRAVLDPTRFDRDDGFGPRAPHPDVLDDHVPTVFRRDGHDAWKAFHLAWLEATASELEQAAGRALSRALPRWRGAGEFDLGEALDDLVEDALYEGLLGCRPSAASRVVGRGVIPFRPGRMRRPGDRAVGRAFRTLAAEIRASPRFPVALAAAHGLEPDAVARDLAFTLPMNAWGAISGTLVSAVAELSRHPVYRRSVAEDAAAARRVLGEVLRLHPAAPVVFGVARGEQVLPAATGPVRVPPGQRVVGVLAMAHRDPARFEAPDRFEPERFTAGATMADLLWDAGAGGGPTPADRTCAARGPALALAEQLLRGIAVEPWSLARPVVWGRKLVPRGVPAAPVRVARYGGSPGGGNRPSWRDRAKVRGLWGLRRLQRASVERWSRRTYRGRPPADAEGLPEVVPAAVHFGTTDIPPCLRVPRTLPATGRMGPAYVAPYYLGAGVAFAALQRFPLAADAPWTPDHPWNELFPVAAGPWSGGSDDEAFVALRTAGPDPFGLRPDGRDRWVVDYGPVFRGVAPPVRCTFALDGARLAPTGIEVDGEVVRPGTGGWARARRLADALEARNTVFVQHLCRTHLVIGQAFALARFQLPAGYPLRPVLDLHSFATLQVNDFAYKLLLSPTSYFIRSRFLTREAAFRMFRNAAPRTSVAHLLAPDDVETRGLDRIDDHPYAAEAPGAWRRLHAYAVEVVDGVYASDAAVAADADLGAWHRALVALLPEVPTALRGMASRADVARWVTALVYNNVAHELCGDFAPYVAEPDATLDLGAAVMGLEGPPRLADALLMRQGAWAGRFDTGGNNLVGTPAEALTPDLSLQRALGRLQADLRRHEAEVRARNARRRWPMPGMEPGRWEASIGF